MKEIIEKGYLYIAQPPLFRVGKGKSEIYLKDEPSLNEHLLRRICSQKTVRSTGNGAALSDHELYLFVGDMAEYVRGLSRLSREGIDPEVIEFLIRYGLDETFLQDREKMLGLKAALEARGCRVGEPEWRDDRGVYEMTIATCEDTQEETIIRDIAAKTHEALKLGRRFVHSPEFQKCRLLSEKLFAFGDPPYTVEHAEKGTDPKSFEDMPTLLAHLLEEGKKGIHIQRYKGLGEMNPEQLWETTMNPAPNKRTLLKVKVEDAVEADEIFTLLMGDVVEPRREFIQSNALEVSTLDI
jgi:DNA gyrase subunit B